MLSLCLALGLGSAACGDDSSPRTDAGPDTTVDSGAADAAADVASSDVVSSDTPDAPEGCVQANIVSWRLDREEDVRVGYEATLDQQVDGATVSLLLWFERYNDTEYTGVVDFSVAPDDNFGTCARCAWAQSLTRPDLTFYAESGQINLRRDPFLRTLDVSGESLRLVQVTLDETRVSTPVEDGFCLEIANFDTESTFVTEGWTCDNALYNDGMCHCDCGAFDPDCSAEFPNPPPVPVDCDDTEICGYNLATDGPACLTRCDIDEANSCGEGICIVDTSFDGVDRCATESSVVSDVALGELCDGPVGLQLYCNVVDGGTQGYCDDARICRLVCESDADCEGTGFDCLRFAAEDGRGFCGTFGKDG